MRKQDKCCRDVIPDAISDNNSENNNNENYGSGTSRRGILIAAAVGAALAVTLTAGAPRAVVADVETPTPEPYVRPAADPSLEHPDLTEPTDVSTEPPTVPQTEPPTDPPVTAPPAPVPGNAADAFKPAQKPYSTVNGRSHEVIRTGTDDGVFAGAVFIGDSRTVGFAEKSGVKATFFADVGIDVNRVLSPCFMMEGGEWKSLATLAAEGGYTKVYMCMGLNEMGWKVSESFISKYIIAASRVRSALPGAVIYVQGIIPVTADAAADKYAGWGGNDKLREYNDLLRKMCAECGLIYLDVYSAFADENGCLLEVYSSDGVHLSAEGYVHWCDYLTENS